MAADGSPVMVGLAISSPPLLTDFAYLAQRMRPDEIAQFLALSGLSEYRADAAARAFANIAGPAWVVLDNGLPILVGGFEPIRPGVFECWLVGTMDGWERHGHAITRLCRRQLRVMFDAGAHRIQTCALASRTQAHEWYERGVGMAREGVQAGHFSDGQDGVMYAAVRKPL